MDKTWIRHGNVMDMLNTGCLLTKSPVLMMFGDVFPCTDAQELMSSQDIRSHL